MLQYWSLVLREGHKLSVFANSVVRKLGSNIKEVLGRLVKLHNSIVGSLNRLVWFDKKLSWRQKKGEYLLDLGIEKCLLNWKVQGSISSDFRRSSSSTLEFLMFQHHKRIIWLHWLIRTWLYMKHPHRCNTAMYSAVSNIAQLTVCKCLLCSSCFWRPV